MSLVQCVSCGSELFGNYCSKSGEKRPSRHDYSVRHFFESALVPFTHLDFKSLRPFKSLLFKPGELTRSYLDGRRKPYVGPIQLFIIVNIAFALFGWNSFRTPLRVQLHDPPFVSLKQAKVAEAIAYRTITEEAFEEKFDSAAGLQAKTWIFSMIPLLALCLAVVFGFRRYFFEHLVFATHFFAFVLIWMTVTSLVASWILLLTGVPLSSQGLDDVVSLATLSGLAVYLFPALRRTYGGGVLSSLLRTLTVVIVFF